MWFYLTNVHAELQNCILDVGMEKEQKQELGWRVSVFPIPAFHHHELLHVHSIQWNA